MADFDLSRAYTEGKLFLEIECGESVLEVSLNGNTSHVIPWHPYRIDITDWVTAGKNRIELKVTNTLINFLEGIQQPSGLLARPRLIHLHRYTLSV